MKHINFFSTENFHFFTTLKIIAWTCFRYDSDPWKVVPRQVFEYCSFILFFIFVGVPSHVGCLSITSVTFLCVSVCMSCSLVDLGSNTLPTAKVKQDSVKSLIQMTGGACD